MGQTLALAPIDHPPAQVAVWVPRSTTKANKGQGIAIRRPLGRLPEVLGFGIFTPQNFAPEAQWSQKSPEIGLKIGFGAKTKNGHGNGCPKPIGHILGQFYFSS